MLDVAFFKHAPNIQRLFREHSAQKFVSALLFSSDWEERGREVRWREVGVALGVASMAPVNGPHALFSLVLPPSFFSGWLTFPSGARWHHLTVTVGLRRRLAIGATATEHDKQTFRVKYMCVHITTTTTLHDALISYHALMWKLQAQWYISRADPTKWSMNRTALPRRQVWPGQRMITVQVTEATVDGSSLIFAHQFPRRFLFFVLWRNPLRTPPTTLWSLPEREGFWRQKLPADREGRGGEGTRGKAGRARSHVQQHTQRHGNDSMPGASPPLFWSHVLILHGSAWTVRVSAPGHRNASITITNLFPSQDHYAGLVLQWESRFRLSFLLAIWKCDWRTLMVVVQWQPQSLAIDA